MPGIFDSGPIDSSRRCLRRLGSLTPRFGHHAAEAGCRKRELKDAGGLRERSIDVVDLLREQLGLIDGGVRRCLEYAKTRRPDLRRARVRAAKTCRTAPSARQRSSTGRGRPAGSAACRPAFACRCARTPSKRRLIQPAKPRSVSPARRSFAPIIGDSVSATTPDTITAPASVNANSRNSAPVSPPWMPTGAYTAASVIVIAMIGPTSSRAASIAADRRTLPL